MFGRRSIAGSLIGGIRETQEMLDFCAAHDIKAEVEVIRAGEIDDAFRRLLAGDVRYLRTNAGYFGIAPDRITAEGVGPADPRADNATTEGRLKNRRVEVVPTPTRQRVSF